MGTICREGNKTGGTATDSLIEYQSDFNNFLCAIMGFASLIDMSMQADNPVRPHFEQIISASDRASLLVSSQLAFSIKLIINPHPIAWFSISRIAVCRDSVRFLIKAMDGLIPSWYS